MANRKQDLIVVTAESRLIPKGRVATRLAEGDYGCHTSSIRRIVKCSEDEALDSFFWRLLAVNSRIARVAIKRIVTRKTPLPCNSSSFGPTQLILDQSAQNLFTKVCADWGTKGEIAPDDLE